MSLSTEQNTVIEKFRQNRNIFVTGPGGTGKSYLLRELLLEAGRLGKRIQVCATSGRAAVLLNCGARTIHSWSGIRLAKGSREAIITQTTKRRNTKSTWKGVDVLVIDEISMLSLKIFEVLNDIGKIARRNYAHPFGGIQIICVGDFFQLPPVGDADDDEGGESSRYCFESAVWRETFQIGDHVKLSKIFRQEDEKFIKLLNQVRIGRISRSSHEILLSLVGRTYEGEFVPVKLFPHRASAEQLNAKMFCKITEAEEEYAVRVNTRTLTYLDDGYPIAPELVEDFKKVPHDIVDFEIANLVSNSPCYQVLKLKIGTKVLLTYNLNTEGGLCNGSLGVVEGFTQGGVDGKGDKLPIVKFTNGKIIPIQYVAYQSATLPCISFTQIPLKHAWASTIHGVQGSTLDMAEIDVGSGIFEIGQSYVALSRVRSLDGLYLKNYDPTKIKVSQKVVDFYATF
jgi:ATP-dependent DNA helicase PIF1